MSFRKVEFNRVYRRLEVRPMGSNNINTVNPSIEIIGNTTISVYGSNRSQDPATTTGLDQSGRYTPPIDDADIATEMTLTDAGLKPGFHKSCMCTEWIAFVPDDLGDPPDVYECGIVDWEYTFRQDEIIC